MKKTIITTVAITIISILGYGQTKTNNYYEFQVKNSPSGGGDQVYITKDNIYIPERKEYRGKFYLNIYSLLTKKLLRKYEPKKEFETARFAIEDKFIYYNTGSAIYKVNIETQNVIWTAKYESHYHPYSPKIFEKHIGINMSDRIHIVDKETGEVFFSKRDKGEDFDQAFEVYDNMVIYGYFDKEKMYVHDTKTGKNLYSIKPGDQLGNGVAKDSNNFIFPSTSVNLTCVDAKTGEKKWYWEHETLEGGCGNGINATPTIVNNRVYSIQRQSGLYIHNKNNGELLSYIHLYENGILINKEKYVYKDHIIIITENSIVAYNTTTEKWNKIADFPNDFEKSQPYTNFYNGKLIVHNIGSYDEVKKVRLFDLAELIKE